MGSVLESVDRRTQMVGSNRLELLLFSLDGKQIFGINVFKVREVIITPPSIVVPKVHPVVRGVTTLREHKIPIMDLSMAIGRGGLDSHGHKITYTIITEFNNAVQGFMVGKVEKIVHMEWREVLPPPDMVGDNNYVTAVTQVDNKIVEIIDVERILAEVVGAPTEITDESLIMDEQDMIQKDYHILIADDSSAARKQVQNTLHQLGISCTAFVDGQQALDFMRKMAKHSTVPIHEQFLMLISDIEMPEMDGYTLSSELRRDPELKEIYIMLHTSISGVFNEALVEKVGANDFVPKWRPDELARAVMKRVAEVEGRVAV
jgi:two-component system, chemotaxis family, chemotaxis protein CheV